MNILWIIGAYLIGSIPFALIVWKLFRQIDIRDFGSGNLGGTNAVRVLGPKLGIPTGLLDIFKAFVIVILAQYVFNFDYNPLYLGIVASVGHCYPVFANFRGGKAVSTTIGAVLAYSPIVGLVAVLVAIIVIKLTKYVSIGSTVFGIAIVIGLLVQADYQAIFPSILLLLFIILRHIPNYKKLLSGTENKAKL